jgi:hypothetical protein
VGMMHPQMIQIQEYFALYILNQALEKPQQHVERHGFMVGHETYNNLVGNGRNHVK